VVQNPETKLWVSKHLGAREKEDWLATLYDLDFRLDHRSPLPLIVSDNWDPIRDAIEEEVYGVEYLPVSHRRGRPFSKSRFVVVSDLKYAQVVKVRDERGNLKGGQDQDYLRRSDRRGSIAHPLGLERDIDFIRREAEPLGAELWKKVRKEDDLLQQGWRVPRVVHRDTPGVVQLHQASQEPENQASRGTVHKENSRDGTRTGRQTTHMAGDHEMEEALT
jgi:hypothetical protein